MRRKRYGAILADPPWLFRNWSEKGEGRNALAHYDCMDFAALCALPVADLAADNCVLFLWVTDPMLPKAFELIKAWGFTYKTVAFYWVKTNHGSLQISPSGVLGGVVRSTTFVGLGYWTRANPEQCLLAVRGKPRRIARDVRRLVVSPRREHSRKPDEVRERIMRLVAGPYLELFARESSPGWDCRGDQARLFNLGPVKTRRRPFRSIQK